MLFTSSVMEMAQGFNPVIVTSMRTQLSARQEISQEISPHGQMHSNAKRIF